jgi:hypothetical protein
MGKAFKYQNRISYDPDVEYLHLREARNEQLFQLKRTFNVLDSITNEITVRKYNIGQHIYENLICLYVLNVLSGSI